MHFRCQKKDLVEGISTVQKAILGKSPMAVLEGIYIETGANEIIMRGSDIDLSIETLVSSSVLEEGRLVIDSKLFGDIIRKLPDATVEIATMENNTILISCENSEFNLLYLMLKNFQRSQKSEIEKRFLSEKMFLKILSKRHPLP